MVQKVNVNSANISYNNRADESRVYEIDGNVNTRSGNVVNIESGMVFENGKQIASFNQWDDNNQQVVWMSVSKEDKPKVQMAIDTFIEEVRADVQVSPINI